MQRTIPMEHARVNLPEDTYLEISYFKQYITQEIDKCNILF